MWPRYGFAGRLPRALRRRLPAPLTGAADVLDLMASPGGRAWWRRFGVTLNVVFDLRLHSRSQQVLTRYLAEKAINPPNKTECSAISDSLLVSGSRS
ncbi:MAG TPA: hypothetical protein VJL29_01235 [Thermoguttaceae bacterium]|nr:hypothetical protein [Thermoguttaceae bacterium]